MNKLKVYVFASSLDGVQKTLKQIENFQDFDVIGGSSAEDEAVKKISFLKPGILFVDFEEIPELEEIGRVIKKTHEQSPSTFIAVLIKRGMTYNMRALYQEGADDFVYKPLDEQSLITIEKNYHRKEMVYPKELVKEKRISKIISFISPKGGSGKTFISINVAIGLANLLQKKVLYIDCSFPFSDVPILLDISYSNKNLYDLVSLLGEGGRENVEDYILHIDTVNLYFLIPPKTLPESSYIFSHIPEFNKTIEYVKDFFDYTIIDLPPRYYDTMPEVIGLSDQIFAVVTSEANSVILLRQFKEELMKQGVPFDFKVIMNRRNKKNLSLIGSEIRTILPEGIFASVEDDPLAVALSYNKGTPTIISSTKNKIGKDLISLTKSIAQVMENG